MSDDVIESAEPQVTNPSRRAALKAGVGLGVGLAAWSGPTITSLGGTPAYAAGCTFVVVIDLSGGCRNTDQGNCPSPTPDDRFGYHTLKHDGLPAGYSLANNVPEGTCCDQNWTPVLHFPAGITCKAVIRLANPPSCTGTEKAVMEYGPSSDGAAGLPIVLACATIQSQTQYTITAFCNTTGAPVECLN